MIFTYPALVHNDPTGLWLEFPDLPGCQTCSPTMDELLADAEEALEFYVVEELEHSGNCRSRAILRRFRWKGEILRH